MNPYGHYWRTRTRPAILARDGNRCRQCGRGGRLDVAHLDGDPSHGDHANLAAHCRQCHIRLDYAIAQAKARWTRAGWKDDERPLLAAL